MNDKASPGADIGLATVLIAVCLLVIYGTLDLPPGSFEPLGLAPIPQFVAGIIIVFSLWIIVQAVSAQRRAATRPTPEATESETPRQRYDLATALVAMALVYVFVMAMDWVRFSIATAVFLAASVGMLADFEKRLVPVVLVLAVVMGVGLEFLFTKVFVIDLP